MRDTKYGRGGSRPQETSLVNAKFKWWDAIAADKSAPSAAFRVAYAIAQFPFEDGETRPSTDSIAQRAGLAQSTVRQMIRWLADHGWLAVTWGKRGSGHANRYRLIQRPAETAGVSEPEKERPFAILDDAAKARLSAGKERRPAQQNSDLSAEKERPFAMNPLDSIHHGETGLPVSLSVGEGESPRVDRASGETARVERADPQIGESAPVGASPRGNSSTIREQSKPMDTGEQGNNIRPFGAFAVTDGPVKTEEDDMREHEQRQQFEKLLRFYPKDRIGADLDNAYDAFDLALTYRTLAELLEDAINLTIAADHGEEVPELVEYLVSKVGITTLAA